MADLPSDEAIAEALRLSGWPASSLAAVLDAPHLYSAIIAFARYIEGHPRND